MFTSRVVLTIASLLLFQACDTRPLGPVRTESHKIPLAGAEMVRVEIAMDAGELKISGGAEQLLDADFRTNLAMPEVDYNSSSFRSRLTIRQKSRLHTGSGLENRWDLRFNNEAPLDMEIKLGAGESRLDFSTLSLRSLEIKMGAGELRVNLDGDYRKDFEVRIRGGVGEANIQLPRKVGALVQAKGGIGEIGIRGRGIRKRGDSYVNDAFDDSKVRIHVDVAGGIGSINLIGEQ